MHSTLYAILYRHYRHVVTPCIAETATKTVIQMFLRYFPSAARSVRSRMLRGRGNPSSNSGKSLVRHKKLNTVRPPDYALLSRWVTFTTSLALLGLFFACTVPNGLDGTGVCSSRTCPDGVPHAEISRPGVLGRDGPPCQHTSRTATLTG